MAKAILFLLLSMIISGCSSGSYPFYDDSGNSDKADAYDAAMEKDMVDEYNNVQSDKYSIYATEQALDDFAAENENNYWEEQQNKEAEIENGVIATQKAKEWEFESSKESAYRGNCKIKGNITFGSGEKIYHVPDQKYYDVTTIDPDYGEKWFCTEAEARLYGWRKAKE